MVPIARKTIGTIVLHCFFHERLWLRDLAGGRDFPDSFLANTESPLPETRSFPRIEKLGELVGLHLQFRQRFDDNAARFPIGLFSLAGKRFNAIFMPLLVSCEQSQSSYRTRCVGFQVTVLGDSRWPWGTRSACGNRDFAGGFTSACSD